jgi:hypothetical protein
VDAALREGRNQLIHRLITSDIWIKTELPYWSGSFWD